MSDSPLRHPALVLSWIFAACSGSGSPDDRSGVYDLVLTATHRDFAAERHFTCEILFELDVRVPLPDSFFTVADALVRRTVVLHGGGGQVVEDTVLRDIPIRFESFPRDDIRLLPLDSAKVVIGGAVGQTVHGTGESGDPGRFDGAWSCPGDLPPSVSEALDERGYPAATVEPGQWNIHAVYAGD